MKNRATRAYRYWAGRLFLIFSLTLAGCAAPRSGGTPVVYDFGPGATQTLPSTRIASLPPLEVSTPQASLALASNAVLYRLIYTDAQQLRPYALARWSMPPAQLIGQRLREQLGRQRPVVALGEIFQTSPARQAASAPAAKQEPLLSLRLELEEFSQLFESVDKSSGLLRLRATVTQRSAAGESLVAQRTFVAKQEAASPDAAGGVRALNLAADQVIGEIEQWLMEMER